ncbi:MULTISPECIES: SDR family oxidoreductase [Sphingobium]|uniref:SDR family NAD(P)-dependent oxidoreductase n=1 Tax=Sphingobium cupriresistens TaxID=1132417 RepID=A0A8G1ZI02_9SPHN|nr:MULTISPECIES: SDR family NAD(P)-dependent oxidoreductase [Sphingobium]RYM11976.1 SDR family NAD(P)-dependent oxidoreductase [Sphingobium cupriresistens]WCP15398.1 putative oxidoreductase [Sphingobium sp. AntQ-1]
MSKLAGRIAIVTGASSGIGAATAHALSAAGATLVLVARRADRLAALAAELGGDALPFADDMADPLAPQRLHDEVMGRFGRADILVNNAGILHAAPVEQFDLDQLRPMIALNYEAVVRTSTLFARSMKAAGTGQIINISSIGANITAPGVGVYGGLKRALEAFTDCLRVELAGSGVKVGIVAPGTTSTEIFEDMKARGQPAWDSFIPAMQPGDVADAVRYMAEQPDRTNMARIQVYAAADSH